MRNKIIEIAEKEIGYKEYSNNHTKYGEWFGVQDEWCAIFISWLANQVGVLDKLIPKQAYVPSMVSWYKNKGLFKARGYYPTTGDIIFFDYNSNGTSDHVGIVEKCENGNIYTIEGNKSQMVKRCMYNVNNAGIYGFGLVQYPQEEGKSKHSIGEVVFINGIYIASNSTQKLNPARNTGTITKIINGAHNPYLLDDGNLGWINDGCIIDRKSASAGFKVGQKVTLKASATKYATGQTIPNWCKNKTYTVMQFGNGKVLLKELYSWVYTKDII